MKKYFSLLIFIMFFTLFLGAQIIIDRFDVTANIGNGTHKSLINSYEEAYKGISFRTIDKQKIELKNLKSRIVILNFWASWCVSCLMEFPSMVAMKKKFKDKEVLLIGINGDTTNQMKNINKVKSKFSLNLPIVADNGQLLTKFKVKALPFSIIFKDGKVVDIVNGAKDYNSDEVIDQFRYLLKN